MFVKKKIFFLNINFIKNFFKKKIQKKFYFKKKYFFLKNSFFFFFSSEKEMSFTPKPTAQEDE